MRHKNPQGYFDEIAQHYSENGTAEAIDPLLTKLVFAAVGRTLYYLAWERGSKVHTLLRLSGLTRSFLEKTNSLHCAQVLLHACVDKSEECWSSFTLATEKGKQRKREIEAQTRDLSDAFDTWLKQRG